MYGVSSSLKNSCSNNLKITYTLFISSISPLFPPPRRPCSVPSWYHDQQLNYVLLYSIHVALVSLPIVGDSYNFMSPA